MSRQVGFYLTVTGAFIYLSLLGLFYLFPVTAAINSSLTSEHIGVFTFMFIMAWPTSLILIAAGREAFPLFKMKWTVPLSLLPFILTIGILFTI